MRALRVFGIKSQENRKVVIVGAGNVGFNIIKIIEKIIETVELLIITLKKLNQFHLNFQIKIPFYMVMH